MLTMFCGECLVKTDITFGDISLAEGSVIELYPGMQIVNVIYVSTLKPHSMLIM